MSCVHSTPRPVTSVPLTAPTCLANRLSALRNGQRPGHRNVEVAGPRHHDLSNASTNAPRRLLLLLHGGRPAVKLQRARVTTSSTPTTPTDSGKASVSCSTAYSSRVVGVRPPLWIGEARRRVDRARNIRGGVGGSSNGIRGGWERGWVGMDNAWALDFLGAGRTLFTTTERPNDERTRTTTKERTNEGRKEGRKEGGTIAVLSVVRWWWVVLVCAPVVVVVVVW